MRLVRERQHKITADQRCQIEALACEKPENSERPITQWSAREIADELIKREIVTEISPPACSQAFKKRLISSHI
ncbi:MAG: helix-turn-helix domain-containing protein [Ignavibacteriales bacterium]|nr:helix-turn-helix domain-containing protein [Ignavibacteriales bacterium]